MTQAETFQQNLRSLLADLNNSSSIAKEAQMHLLSFLNETADALMTSLSSLKNQNDAIMADIAIQDRELDAILELTKSSVPPEDDINYRLAVAKQNSDVVKSKGLIIEQSITEVGETQELCLQLTKRLLAMSVK